MFKLIEQVFIALLNFNRFWATKCVSSNNKPCMIRLILIDSNPVELNYHPFVISLGKSNGSCWWLIYKIMCYEWKKKDLNVKVFNMETRIY